MPDLIPGLDRRGGRDPWAAPSIVPEGPTEGWSSALQEMIDRGMDPDDAAERLEEQADRWS